MADSTRQAWLVPALGVALILLALWMIGANEHAAATWHRGMQQPAGQVQILRADAQPAKVHDGQMVLVSGTPTVTKLPRDPDFAVQADTTLLVRQVAMFQWHEEHAGSEVSYQQDWIDHPVDSRHFERRRGHANPHRFPFTGRRFEASDAHLGNYVLAPAIVRALPGTLRMLVPEFSGLPANMQASFRIRNGMLTTSADAQRPQLGDLRVRWLVRPLQTVTVVARVKGNALVPGDGPGDGFEVRVGTSTLTDIYPRLPLPLHGVWAWRAGALVLAWIGIWLVLQRRHSPRSALYVALAAGFVPLGILAGIMWVATSWKVAVLAWIIVIAVAVSVWQVWRRFA